MKLFIFEKPDRARQLQSALKKIEELDNTSVAFIDKPWQIFTLINKEANYQFEVLNFQYRYYIENILSYPFEPSFWTYKVSNTELYNTLMQYVELANEVIFVYSGDRSSILLMQSILNFPEFKARLKGKKISWLPLTHVDEKEFLYEYSKRESKDRLIFKEIGSFGVRYHLFYNEVKLQEPTDFLITDEIRLKYLEKYKIDLSQILGQNMEIAFNEISHAKEVMSYWDKKYKDSINSVT